VVQPVELGIHTLQASYQQAQVEDDTSFISRPDHFTRLAGTEQLRTLLEQGASPQTIIETWAADIEQFRNRRSPYLLY
jgi:uncharacterized protein YbbC (DUF1343 family)